MDKLIEDPVQVRKIVESPEPDAPRRAYAQWLRQHGNSFDSDFIDVQLDLAAKFRAHARVKEWAPLSDRSEGMLKIGRVGWTQALHKLIDAEQISSPVFMRGFVEQVTVDASRLDAVADELYELAPILHLTLRGVAGHTRALSSPALSRIVSLNIEGEHCGDEAIATMAASPHVARLRWLDISSNRLTDNSLHALCGSPYLRNLGYVNCVGNRFQDPTDVVYSEGEEIIQTDPSDIGAQFEQRYGRVAWFHAPDVFDAAFPPLRLALEPA